MCTVRKRCIISCVCVNTLTAQAMVILMKPPVMMAISMTMIPTGIDVRMSLYMVDHHDTGPGLRTITLSMLMLVSLVVAFATTNLER